PLLNVTLSSAALRGAEDRVQRSTVASTSRSVIGGLPFWSVRGLELAGRGAAGPRLLAAPAQDRGHDDEELERHEAADVGVASGAEAVGVETGAEHEVDAVPGHEHAKVADDRAHGHPEVLDPADEPAVEDREVAEEGDERPRFLGVPSPEASPGVGSPDSPEGGAHGEEERPDLQRAVEEER